MTPSSFQGVALLRFSFSSLFYVDKMGGNGIYK